MRALAWQAGLRTECQRGFYNPDVNMEDAGACRACPQEATTPGLAAVSIGQCYCDNGFVPRPLSSLNGTDFECICPPGLVGN